MIVIASHEVRFIVAEQLQALGLEAEIVVEPSPRTRLRRLPLERS
jgi:mannose-1-phosphate guanylyltransferase